MGKNLEDICKGGKERNKYGKALMAILIAVLLIISVSACGSGGSSNDSGNESVTDSSDDSGTGSGDDSGSDTGTDTGNDTGSDTGNDSGDDTGNDTGNDTGDDDNDGSTGSTDVPAEIESKTVASGETWEVTGTTTVETLTIEVGGEVYAPEGYSLTLIVGGVEIEGATTITEGGVEYKQYLTPGTYSDVEIDVTEFVEYAGSWNWKGATDNAPYRAAALITSDGLVSAMSATGAISAGTYDGSSASDVEIEGESGDFSGFLIDDVEYSISGAKITLGTPDVDGSNTNDFAGLGAAIMVSGDDAKLTITDSAIETDGVAKLPIFVDNGASLLMENSIIWANGGTLYDGYMATADQSMMIAPPWVLGLDCAVANARGSNLMGNYSLAAYVDCDVDAFGWAGLSTDSGSLMHLAVVNTTIDVENSGYGTYVIGSCTQDFYGASIDAGTIGIILTGGHVTLDKHVPGTTYSFGKMERSSSETFGVEGDAVFTGVTSSATETVNSSITAGNFGIMAWQDSVLDVEAGTTISSGDAVFLIKAGSQEINVDNATLTSNSGVLLQMFDNDDSATGVNQSAQWGMNDLFYGHTYGTHMPTFNEIFSEEDGYSDAFGNASSHQTRGACELNLENGDYEGDIWNSSGYIADASSLTVTIGNGATLSGRISCGAYQHVEKTIVVGNGDWSEAENLGLVSNKPYHSGINTVKVVINAGSTWHITGDGYITEFVNNGSYDGGTITDMGDYYLVEVD